MTIFETNKDNDEYYVIDAKLAVGSMITSKIIPVEIKKEAETGTESRRAGQKGKRKP